MKIKYIEQINGFWYFYDKNKEKLSISDITLYFVLLRYCNKLNWLNPFTINPFLISEINPLSNNTYYKSLELLNNLGLIRWIKGKHNVSNMQITIIKFDNSLNNSIDNSIKSSIEISVDSSVDVSIGTNNNTIIQLDNNTIIQLEKEKAELIIENLKFKKLLELQKPKKITTKDNFDFSLFSENEVEVLNLWIEYRKEKKKPLTQQAVNLFKKDFTKYGISVVKTSIENSIKSSYQGIFYDKSFNSSTQTYLKINNDSSY